MVGTKETERQGGEEAEGKKRTDLAVVRPDGAFRPERGPDGAAVRDVLRVEHPQAAKVVEIVRRDADLWYYRSGEYSCRR